MKTSYLNYFLLCASKKQHFVIFFFIGKYEYCILISFFFFFVTEKPEEDPFHLYAELRDMLRDLTVFGQITNLMKTLRRTYQGYVSSH